jgi:hypothetical protein
MTKKDQEKNSSKTFVEAYFKLPSETYEFFTRSTDTTTKMYNSWLKATTLLSKGKIRPEDLSNTLSKDFEAIYSEIFETLFRPMKIISGRPLIDFDTNDWPKFMGLMGEQNFWTKPFERFMSIMPKKVPKLFSELVEAYRSFYDSWKDYSSILSTTWKDTSTKFSKELTEKTANIKNGSEQSLEFWDFYNLWLETYQKTFTDILCLPEIISVQTKLSTSTMEIVRIWRELMEELVNASPSFPLSTKSEMDDVYKRIHDLRTEIDELRTKLDNSKPANQNSSEK